MKPRFDRKRLRIPRILAPLLALLGCTTTGEIDQRPAYVRRGEGMAIGRVRVRFNDKFYTKECTVCLRGTAPADHSPAERCVALNANGILFVPLPPGRARLSTLSCGDASHQIPNASFDLPQGTAYFGDVVIEWKEATLGKGGGAIMAAGAVTGGLVGLAVGWTIASSLRKPGRFVVSLDDDDNPYGVVNAYRQYVHDPRAPVSRHLVELEEE
jgi:hypothetical protein